MIIINYYNIIIKKKNEKHKIFWKSLAQISFNEQKNLENGHTATDSDGMAKMQKKKLESDHIATDSGGMTHKIFPTPKKYPKLRNNFKNHPK